MSDKVVAIIIAAGYSTRMGGVPKALLNVGYESAIERICGTYQACGINRILVVLGDHEEQISPLLDHLKIDWVKNPDPSRGMFSSIITALQSDLTKDCSFLIHPVDIPLISIETIVSILKRKSLDEREELESAVSEESDATIPEDLIPASDNLLTDNDAATDEQTDVSTDEATDETTEEPLPLPMSQSDKFIYAPSMDNRRGHPPLFGRSFREMFLAMDPAEDNLRDFQNSNLDITQWVLCDDPHMFTDMDFPADFEEVNKIALTEKIPSVNDCRRFLKEHQKNTKVSAHSEAVLQIAKFILIEMAKGESYNGKAIDRTGEVRLECAAILHDIKKGTSCHDREGAALIRRWGYHQIAALINVHMNYLPLVNNQFVLPLSPINKTESNGADPEKTEVAVTCTDGNQTNVTEADVTEADVTEADDTEADDTEADVTEADVTEADVTATDISEPNVVDFDEITALIDERAILFLADKMVKGDKPVSVEAKFRGSEQKFFDNPEALEAISKRKEAAGIIYGRIFS